MLKVWIIAVVIWLLPLACYATDYEVFDFGLSDDGVVWTVHTVEVPVDGYVTVDFNGSTVWFWGSQFSEAELPVITQKPDCYCSVHISSLCCCLKQCWITEGGKYKQGECK